MVPFQATCEFCACAEWSSKNSDPQREVSLSLSPLTLSILFVRYCCRNHNQTRANVKLQWADPKRSNFQPRFLNHSIDDLKEFTSSTKLAMELVATKLIRQGEEVFLDYGDEWEQAWQDHVQTWQPVLGAADYLTAKDLTEAWKKGTFSWDPSSGEDPTAKLPAHVDLMCNDFFEYEWQGSSADDSSSLEQDLAEYNAEHRATYWYCDIVNTTTMVSRNNTTELRYQVQVSKKRPRGEKEKGKQKKTKFWSHCPIQVFSFQDKPYTSDLFLPNAFRHDMRIPNDLFPKAWRNLVSPSR